MSTASLSKLKVLIVDDNQNMRILLRSLLCVIGVKNIIDASDGDKGFKVFQEHAFDIVLCDIRMEPADGFSLLEKIRTDIKSRNPYIPFIFLSGHGEAIYVKKARDLGMNEFMVKPVTLDTLQQKIESALNNPRSFIKQASYVGPDRRRQERPIEGKDRRCYATSNTAAKNINAMPPLTPTPH